MHVKQYCALICLLGILVAWLAYWASSKRYAWWKDAAQIASVMVVVALGLAAITPPMPRNLVAEAAAAEREASAAEEKLRDRQMDEAISACTSAIQGHLQYPGSYSGTIFSSSNRQFATAQGWEIFRAFEAKNGFGGSLPHVGHCSITRSGTISVEISRS